MVLVEVFDTDVTLLFFSIIITMLGCTLLQRTTDISFNNHISTQAFKEKYEPLSNLRRAQQLWQMQYDDAGVPAENGGVARR